MKKYFEEIEKKIKEAYDSANEAKIKGFDPSDEVEIPLAKNMAERVVGLIKAVAPQIDGERIVNRFQELEKGFGPQDWRVALKIAEEVAQQKFGRFDDEREAMEVGIRVGFAYVTVGVVASPLEGFVELKINQRRDGKKYFCLMYSGPIRSAGGTGASVSVLIADYVRKKMGYDIYDPTDLEIKRGYTELLDYHERVTNLQYLPSEEETEFMIKNLPVQINGDPSEKFEVSNYKDLDRIKTNRLRNGFCLVIGECLAQKAPKLLIQLEKWGKDFDLDHWRFLKEFVDLQKAIKAKKAEKKLEGKLSPDYTYIKDLVAGRPVLTHPLRKGGLRLRYGRCRSSGFSSCAVHPATMKVVNDFIAIGTQLKMERPGKATTLSICDKIEGPIVKLKNGNVVFLDTEDKAEKYAEDIEEVLYLGDILISYGDFLDRAHKLVPCGFNEEWYVRYLEKIEKKDELIRDIINNPYLKISGKDAIEISKKYNVPLHPRYTYHWKDISKEQFSNLAKWFEKSAFKEKRIILPFGYDLNQDMEEKDPKRILELLGIPHYVVSGEHVVIEGEDAYVLREMNLGEIEGEDILSGISKLGGIEIKDKSGTFIGSRMGRPEKAKLRKLTGNPHILFPVGNEGGKMRSFQLALEKRKIKANFPLYYCNNCDKGTIYPICEKCGRKTEIRFYCSNCNKILKDSCKQEGHVSMSCKKQEIDINCYFKCALEKLGLKKYEDLVKGVRGMSSSYNIPENLVKGILRSMFNLHVNKDGTIRYDMTEMTITHFKPKEIGTSISKLKELGYSKDIYGKALDNEEQILELKVQDVILPNCKESLEEGSKSILFRITRFIDELLVKLYGLEPFYNLKNEDGLVGHLVVAMSPHTSAGVVSRIVGFSKTQGFFAHPLLHSLMRRDCDGDEAGIMVLMDALLNFSKKYLPSHRGTTQDAPLVLTSHLVPSEVDDMVFHMDVVWKYPLELYEAAEQYKNPWDVKIEVFGDNLGTDKQYEGLGFTHDVEDINNGNRCSAYKSIPTMQEKVLGQMEIAEKIRAVDEIDVAKLVIERHFIRDIKGNLRKFSMQQFRCVDCNEKYRRPPLIGKCKCGGKLIFTIAEGSIVKYLEPSIQLAEKYALPPYLRQSLELTRLRIESVFGKDKEKQEGLVKWF